MVLPLAHVSAGCAGDVHNLSQSVVTQFPNPRFKELVRKKRLTALDASKLNTVSNTTTDSVEVTFTIASGNKIEFIIARGAISGVFGKENVEVLIEYGRVMTKVRAIVDSEDILEGLVIELKINPAIKIDQVLTLNTPSGITPVQQRLKLPIQKIQVTVEESQRLNRIYFKQADKSDLEPTLIRIDQANPKDFRTVIHQISEYTGLEPKQVPGTDDNVFSLAIQTPEHVEGMIQILQRFPAVKVNL